MLQSLKMKNKRGQQASAFAQVLGLVVMAVLVIVAIFLFVNLSSTFTAGSAEANAADTMIVQFGTYPVLIGLVGTVLFLGLVIGVLVVNFARGGSRI